MTGDKRRSTAPTGKSGTEAKSPKVHTNDRRGSLVKVVVSTDQGKWISPAKDSIHSISSDAAFPSIDFTIETTAPPPYRWSWTVKWDAKVSGLKESPRRGKKLKTFVESGRLESDSKSWTATPGKIVGGTLTIEVFAGAEKFRRSVTIKGTNPDATTLDSHVKTLPNTAGFDKILEQETKKKHFIDADGQPIVAFDGGYGMTQLTRPAPTFEQAWDWKANVKVGAALYQRKQQEAKKYLGQSKRTYTEDQLKLETWSRWNGGGYHTWNANDQVWIRNETMLCDSQTGNIGWDTRVDANKSKSESELHERDSETYKKPKERRPGEHSWQYTGICYADHLNDH